VHVVAADDVTDVATDAADGANAVDSIAKWARQTNKNVDMLKTKGSFRGHHAKTREKMENAWKKHRTLRF
jgi:4-aminobutyrate aminotransferase-like enzyme